MLFLQFLSDFISIISKTMLDNNSNIGYPVLFLTWCFMTFSGIKEMSKKGLSWSLSYLRRVFLSLYSTYKDWLPYVIKCIFSLLMIIVFLLEFSTRIEIIGCYPVGYLCFWYKISCSSCIINFMLYYIRIANILFQIFVLYSWVKFGCSFLFPLWY